MEYINLNGSLIKRSDAFIHVSDLSIHRGYGIFDFFKMINGENPWLEHYFNRFYNSLNYAGISFEYSRDELMQMILGVMNKNGLESSYIKLVATGGYSSNGYSPDEKSNLMIFTFSIDRFLNKPEGQGYNLISANFIRPNPLVKSTNYFNSVMHYPKMQKYDAVDVLYHFNGRLSECSRCNVFVVKDAMISTPDEGMLEGVTRRRVIEQRENGFDIKIRPIDTLEIFSADEIFISSSTKGVMPIICIDGTLVNGGKVGPLSKEISSYMEVF